jgi:hypothetical protein
VSFLLPRKFKKTGVIISYCVATGIHFATFFRFCRSRTMMKLFLTGVILNLLVVAFAFTTSSFGVSHRSSSLTFLSARKGKDHFDMDELRLRIQQELNPCHQLFSSASGGVQPAPERVHVILFHLGTEQQSAHTIEYPTGSGSNVLLAFASEASCKKFADALKEQQFFDPTVRFIDYPPLDRYPLAFYSRNTPLPTAFA